MSETDSEDERLRLWEEARWSDREMFDFASGVQRYGFRNVKKIAQTVKTKSEEAVSALISREVGNISMEMFGFRVWHGPGNFQSLRPKKERTVGWPVLRKWQKIAQNTQTKAGRKVDYSCLLIPAAWERFREEAKSPLSSQELDVPAIYSYVIECIQGRKPPELPPKESATVVILMHLMEKMLQGLDMEEEMQFAQKFKKPTTFVAMDDKSKKKRSKKRKVCSVPPPPDAVYVPKKIHLLLKEHRRLVQSFNPLTVPLWLLHKEQKQLGSMFDNEPPTT